MRKDEGIRKDRREGKKSELACKGRKRRSIKKREEKRRGGEKRGRKEEEGEMKKME